ncbi:MAG: DUF6049 family protein [Ancrocorticia sp.]|uniref:DUF6049 family protein n=1 Tax=Ancrocorticia sp. TaxID=2593684 RepID=UPI003F922581
MSRVGRSFAAFAALLLPLGSLGAIVEESHATVVHTVISDDDGEASPTQSPAPTPTGPQATEPEATITSVGESTMDQGEDLHVDVSVSNPSSEPLDINSLSLSGHFSPIMSRTELARFMEGGGGALSPLFTDTSAQSIAPGGQRTLSMTVPAEQLQWSGSFDSWGPRGLQVEVLLGDGTWLADRSIAVVAPAPELMPMPAAVAMPVTHTAEELLEPSLSEDIASISTEPDGPASTPTPTATPTDSEESDAAESSRASTSVSEMSTPGVSLFVDPALAHGDDSLATSLSDFEGTADTEVFLTPIYDADTTALTHAGAEEMIQQAYSSSEALAEELEMSADTDVAFVSGKTDQNTMNALDEAGVEGVLLSDQTIPQTGFSYATASARTSIQAGDVQMPGLAVDSLVSSALAGQIGEGEESAELSALDSQQMVLGLSALTYRERPNDPRAMVLAIDRAGLTEFGGDPAAPSPSSSLTEEDISGTIEALMEASWVDPHTVSDLIALEPSVAEREALPEKEANPGEITEAQIDQLSQAQKNIGWYANVSEDPSLIADPTQATVQKAFATCLRGQNSVRQELIGSLENLSSQFSDSLNVQPSSTINVISEATELPLHVRNDLPLSAGVVIQINSHDNRLVPKQDVAVSLPAEGTSDVAVPVEARGSGNVQVEVRILDPAGNVIGPSQTVQIRVRADWENVGTLVIAVGLAGIFSFGIVRSLRRGRQHAPVDPKEFSQDQRATRRAAWRHGK